MRIIVSIINIITNSNSNNNINNGCSDNLTPFEIKQSQHAHLGNNMQSSFLWKPNDTRVKGAHSTIECD